MGQAMEPMDLALVGQVLEGDVQAFNRLVARWERGIYCFVYRVVGHEEDARDLVQETMIRVYQGLDRLKDPAKFPSWLFRIAHNVCLDKLRSGKNRSMISKETLVENGMERILEERIDRFQGLPDPDEALYRRELSEILGQALMTLSEEQRTALVMREYHGYTSREIADILGIPVGTVRSRIFHGLRNLERVLRRLRAEEGR
ncbi:MAG: sigma-70 family RNA polymerase sigma factor [Candidatus Eisenbacteria bacterium]|nr:sigma-70 family RNA polymerase sigma factor [Candidatus Eisenbacteria bacterium]